MSHTETYVQSVHFVHLYVCARHPLLAHLLRAVRAFDRIDIRRVERFVLYKHTNRCTQQYDDRKHQEND